EGLCCGVSSSGETHCVIAGDGKRAVGTFGSRLADPRTGVTEIPGEAMRTRRFLEPRGAAAHTEPTFFVLATVGRFRIAARAVAWCGGACKAPDKASSGIQNFELDVIRRGLGEVVIDICTGKGLLGMGQAAIERAADASTRTHGGAGREQVIRCSVYLI